MGRGGFASGLEIGDGGEEGGEEEKYTMGPVKAGQSGADTWESAAQEREKSQPEESVHLYVPHDRG